MNPQTVAEKVAYAQSVAQANGQQVNRKRCKPKWGQL
jgi:hypothetical protein